jgi:hypothetical protein
LLSTSSLSQILLLFSCCFGFSPWFLYRNGGSCLAAAAGGGTTTSYKQRVIMNKLVDEQDSEGLQPDHLQQDHMNLDDDDDDDDDDSTGGQQQQLLQGSNAAAVNGAGAPVEGGSAAAASNGAAAHSFSVFRESWQAAAEEAQSLSE